LIISSGGSYSWVHPHVRVYFIIIKDVFIFHCPVGALKQMFLLSSAQQGSDPVFIFTTLLDILNDCLFPHSLSLISPQGFFNHVLAQSYV